jgi:hypothetical protein
MFRTGTRLPPSNLCFVRGVTWGFVIALTHSSAHSITKQLIDKSDNDISKNSLADTSRSLVLASVLRDARFLMLHWLSIRLQTEDSLF